jgi:hypothetical protein
MKKLITLLLFFFNGSSFAQCDNNAYVFSITPGITKSGAIFSMEAGIWPIAGKIGIMAGPMIYDEKYIIKDGTEKITQMDFAGRITYKLTSTGSNSPQLFTLSGSVRGMLSISYRCYFSIGERELLGIEPFYANKIGPGVNILFTARL